MVTIKKGSITVFSALMFSCIMILVSSLFKASQIRLAESTGKRLLKVSTDAILTEYDKELWQDYKMFFLPGQNKYKGLWDSKLKEYIIADLDPAEGGMKNYGINNHIKLISSSIVGVTSATDYQNKAVKYQICQWMQYKVGLWFFNRIVGNLGELQVGQNDIKRVENEIEEAKEELALLESLQEESMEGEMGNENVIEREESEKIRNPLDGLRSLLKKGYFGLLLIDESKISSRELDLADARYALSSNKAKEARREVGSIGDIVKEDDGESVLDFLKSFQQEFPLEGQLDGLSEGLTDDLLLDEYILTYLKGFEHEKSLNDKETKILYEQEYILFGMKSDEGNLSSMMEKLVMLRTGVNFLHIVADMEKRELAYAASLALVGYTLMEPLIRLTQIAIMAGWALEEGIVDTAALIKGYNIPLIKTKSNFQISFSEIALFKIDMVRRKVEAYESKENTMGYFGYQDYMRLFLLFMDEDVKTCRLMDVIQENMRLRYRNDFDFDLCIFGLKTNAKFKVHSNISFEKEYECAY